MAQQRKLALDIRATRMGWMGQQNGLRFGRWCPEGGAGRWRSTTQHHASHPRRLGPAVVSTPADVRATQSTVLPTLHIDLRRFFMGCIDHFARLVREVYRFGRRIRSHAGRRGRIGRGLEQ